MANYAIFDEKYYLASYPWIKPAIDAGIIKSGREHFEKFGQAGGLTKVSRYFDEATYLEGNSDLQPFVKTVNPNAPFATGLDHFIQFGYDEGQRRAKVSPEYNEDFYLANNSELRSFIGPNGAFKSGYQHSCSEFLLPAVMSIRLRSIWVMVKLLFGTSTQMTILSNCKVLL